ncbi:hypothetical protein VDGL01_05918 [Verticillium dahliae]
MQANEVTVTMTTTTSGTCTTSKQLQIHKVPRSCQRPFPPPVDDSNHVRTGAPLGSYSGSEKEKADLPVIGILSLGVAAAFAVRALWLPWRRRQSECVAALLFIIGRRPDCLPRIALAHLDREDDLTDAKASRQPHKCQGVSTTFPCAVAFGSCNE